MPFIPITMPPAALSFSTTGESEVGLYSFSDFVPADVQKPLTFILSLTATSFPVRSPSS